MAGLFSAHISYQSPNAPSSTNEAQSPTPNRIGILVKAWQNSAVANYGLSLSYDIKSKTTCALLHGNDVYDPKSYDHLCKLIKISISSWGGHPMLLPTILYGDHISRMHPVAAEYEDSVIRIEGQLGVARSGRNRGNHVPQRVANVREQSMHMYTVLTNLLFLLHCSNWQRRYADFLLENLDPESKESLSSYLDDDQALVTLQLRQEVKHMASESESIESLLKQLRSRLEKQLDVLNNQLNAKMAASAVRDSTSMRILAAIASLFLPGTFIATLFSMSMFDWQGSGDASASSSGMISKYFWVYWVVAIPLTLLVMLAWRSWWVYSNSHFDKDIRAFMEDVEKNAEHDRGGSSKVKNHLKKAKEEEAADM